MNDHVANQQTSLPVTTSQLMDTYARLPVRIERGEGAWLFDDTGQAYLDAVAGIGVCSLGHAHPELAETIAEQARTLIHAANLVEVPWQEPLAAELCARSGMDNAFLANSGLEAIECAIKLTRLIAHQRGIDEPRVAVATRSFHGRSLAAISASGSDKARTGFEPLVTGFTRVPYGDSEALRQALDEDEQIIAVMVEPIQGEAGVNVPPDGYLRALRRHCDETGRLLVADEIQTGLCRTGHWYACTGQGVTPDILTTAKALGNGVPIGACLARGEAARAFTPGRHGSTFGGNPLACRTACKVLEIMARDGIAAHAGEIGQRLLSTLRDELAEQPGVVDVRGRGLMIGVELDRPAAPARLAALERGLLINVTAERVIRLLPPLIIDRDEADRIAEGVIEAVRACVD